MTIVLTTVNLLLMTLYLRFATRHFFSLFDYLYPSSVAILLLCVMNIYAAILSNGISDGYLYLQKYSPTAYGVTLATYWLCVLIIIKILSRKFYLAANSWRTVFQALHKRLSLQTKILLIVLSTSFLALSYKLFFSQSVARDDLIGGPGLVFLGICSTVSLPMTVFISRLKSNEVPGNFVAKSILTTKKKKFRVSRKWLFLIPVYLLQFFLLWIIQSNIDRKSFLAWVVLQSVFVMSMPTVDITSFQGRYRVSQIRFLAIAAVLFIALLLFVAYGYYSALQVKGIDFNGANIGEIVLRVLQANVLGVGLGGYNINTSDLAIKDLIDGLRIPFYSSIYGHPYEGLIQALGQDLLDFQSESGGAGVIAMHAYVYNYGLVLGVLLAPFAILLMFAAEYLIFQAPVVLFNVTSHSLSLLTLFGFALYAYKPLLYAFLRGADSLVPYPPFLYDPFLIILFLLLAMLSLFKASNP